VVLRASLDVLEKRNISPASDGIRTLDRPACSIACICAIFDEVPTVGTSVGIVLPSAFRVVNIFLDLGEATCLTQKDCSARYLRHR